MKMSAQLSAVLLLLLVSGIPAARLPKAGAKPSGCHRSSPRAGSGETHFFLRVTDSVTHIPDKYYNVSVAHRGPLLGGMRRLMESREDFKFTYHEDYNYGPFLDSVNGLLGNKDSCTYWQVLVKTKEKIKPIDVGIGCYIPQENDQVFLTYSKW